jgi:hypothetical protein
MASDEQESVKGTRNARVSAAPVAGQEPTDKPANDTLIAQATAWLLNPYSRDEVFRGADALQLVTALRDALVDSTKFCPGEWPCEASTAAAYLERELGEAQQERDTWAGRAGTANAEVVLAQQALGERDTILREALAAITTRWDANIGSTLVKRIRKVLHG